jgi:regulator of protease activity HflC (stomatin/prohibitin superfamily)
MDVVVIVHIPLKNAPKIVANFGTVQNLISQVLQSTISSYFRNSAQGVDALELYQDRKEIQKRASEYIKEILEKHYVECRDVLIDDVVLPEQLTKPLTDRQVAEQEKQTYTVQTLAQQGREELQKASALADIQGQIVTATQGVEIATKLADAVEKTAKGASEAIILNADANAHKTKVEGNATAEVTLSIGTAEATVVQKKVDAMGEGYALVQAVEKLMTGDKAIVPTTLIQGGGAGTSAIETLLGMKLVGDVITKTQNLVIEKKEKVNPEKDEKVNLKKEEKVSVKKEENIDDKKEK